MSIEADPARAELERVRELSDRVSDEELSRPLDADWTPAGLIAHIAFWDRFCRARWLHAARTGRRVPAHIEDAFTDLVNDANIPHWNRVPPRTAIEECLEAGREVDDLIHSLDPEVIADMIAEGRHRLVDRSIHRSEHLDVIERAFPRRKPD
jgi:hypothetical protein